MRHVHYSTVFRFYAISIHAPTWGATSIRRGRSGGNAHFNPRTHVGCDEVLLCHYRVGDISIHAPTWGATGSSTPISRGWIISIHAPTWGATCCPFRMTVYQPISIHAPTWGATSIALFISVASDDFNPRTHVGCDPFTNEVLRVSLISIHAPTWGATLVTNFYDFVSRFQSTHPRGVRPDL